VDVSVSREHVHGEEEDEEHGVPGDEENGCW
jgi:hypothetical protein